MKLRLTLIWRDWTSSVLLKYDKIGLEKWNPYYNVQNLHILNAPVTNRFHKHVNTIKYNFFL
jgi:hypothetical protein